MEHQHSGAGAGAGAEQEGQHVCHRCGWPFPNPHPSAKHRRAHKKHCSKIDGYLLAAVDDVDDHQHSADQPVSPTGQVVDAAKPEEPAAPAPVGIIIAVGGGNHSDDAAVVATGGADDTVEHCDLLHGNQGQDSDVAVAAYQLERGIQLEDSTVPCTTAADASNNDEESSGFPGSREANLVDCSHEKTHSISAQHVLNLPAIVNHTDSGCYLGNEINTASKVTAKLIDPASDSSAIDLKFDKLEEHTKIHAPSNHASVGATAMNCVSDEVFAEVDEFYSYSFYAVDNQADAKKDVSETEDSTHAEAFSVKISSGVHQATSDNVPQLDNPYGLAGYHKVEVNEDERTAPSKLTYVENSEIKHRDCEDHESMVPYECLPSAGTESRKEPEYYLADKDPQVVISDLTLVDMDGSADDVSTTMLLETLWTTNSEFDSDDVVENIHGNMDSFLYVDDLKDEAVLPLPESTESFVTNGTEARPHSAIEGSTVAEAIAFNGPLTSSCEINVAPVQSEAIETQCLADAQEACNNLSHQDTPANDMLAANVGDFTPADVTDATKTNKILEGTQLFTCKETHIHYNDVTVEQIHEALKDDASKLQPRSDGDTGKSGLDESQQLTISISGDNFIEPENNGVCSRNLEGIPGPQSHQIDDQISVQERFTEIAVDSDGNGSVLQTGIKTEDQILESSAEEYQEEMDHQKMEPDHQENISQPHLGDIVQTEDVDETSAGSAVVFGNDQHVRQPKVQIEHNETESRSCNLPFGNDLPVTQSEIQIEHNETESKPCKLPHEELNVAVIQEGSSDYRSGQSSTLEGPLASQVESEPCLQKSMTIEESKTSDIHESVLSGTCHQSSGDGAELLVLNQQSDAALVAADTSLDSNSQSDSIEGQWGSVSEVTIPPTRHYSDGDLILSTGNPPATVTKTAKELHVSKTSSEGVAEFNNVDNSNTVFKAPSFMTLVESSRQPGSNEIQSIHNPQDESHGRKKQEEIMAKVLNWSPGKHHTPLKSLLVEANLESKQRTGYVQDHHMSSPTKNVRVMQDEGRKPQTPTAKIELENSSDSFSKADQREWNSPAKFPERKNNKRVKGKPTWMPFICCPSMN